MMIDNKAGLAFVFASAGLKTAALKTVCFFLLLACAACTPSAGESAQTTYVSNTWSIVAADPLTGDVGLALASCVPDLHADLTAALVPDKGVAATQAEFDLGNRDRVFAMLQDGQPAGAIIDTMTDFDNDPIPHTRQYGVVTIHDGEATVAAYTGSSNSLWAGDLQDQALSVTVQGNFLESEEVVRSALQAFRLEDDAGYNALPDRLMRALEAGSLAGGDARCNTDQNNQTAAAAIIMVARGGDPPYAIERPGETDAGTPAAPWLTLSVAESRFGPNPIPELRRQYDAWRLANLDQPDEGVTGQDLLLPAVVVVLVVAAVAIVLWRRNRPSA